MLLDYESTQTGLVQLPGVTKVSAGLVGLRKHARELPQLVCQSCHDLQARDACAMLGVGRPQTPGDERLSSRFVNSCYHQLMRSGNGGFTLRLGPCQP